MMILLTGGLKYCVDCHTYLTIGIAVNYLYTIIARVINILYSTIKICLQLTVKYKMPLQYELQFKKTICIMPILVKVQNMVNMI